MATALSTLTVSLPFAGHVIIALARRRIKAARPMKIAADPAGIPWYRRQAGDTREPIDGVESVQVAAAVREKRRGEHDSEPRQAQQTSALSWRVNCSVI